MTDTPAPTPLTEAAIAEMAERAAKATPGPWRPCGGKWVDITSPCTEEAWDGNLVQNGRKSLYIVKEGGKVRWPDAQFIAHARADIPALLAEVRRLREALRMPTEAMWGGLARDLIMWHDMTQPWERTPRELFKHLERAGREIPQWLRDEPEMQALDHVPSKGTRAVLIWRAMVRAALPEETSNG